MPLERCQEGGQNGWRWGSQKCFVGPGAKKKAIKQGLAITQKTGEKFDPSQKKSQASDQQLDAEASRIVSRQEEFLDDLERAMMDQAQASPA